MQPHKLLPHAALTCGTCTLPPYPLRDHPPDHLVTPAGIPNARVDRHPLLLSE